MVCTILDEAITIARRIFLRDRDTRFDLAKSGIIGKILMSRPHRRPLKIFKVFLYIFFYYFKNFSGTGKNYAYCKCE